MSEARDSLEIEMVENPAADLLRVLFDYKELMPADIASLREGRSDAVLVGRLEQQLRRLNTWLDSESVGRAISALTRISSIDLIDANEQGHIRLTYGTTLPYTDEKGRRQDRTVRYFDFDDVGANIFEFSRQVAIKGPRQEIVPDIVIYVNGIPLAVIECKSPALADPIGEAQRQFRRYEGRDEFAGLGAPRLFEMAQIRLHLPATLPAMARPLRHHVTGQIGVIHGP